MISIYLFLPIFSIAIICMLLQWNYHLNGTTFQSGLRFQTSLSSLWVSCKCALRVKVDAPLSSADIKFILNQKRGQICHCFFYEPWLRYIVNQSGSAKETVNWSICKNIEMLVCFICIDRALIDINHHCQIKNNLHKS